MGPYMRPIPIGASVAMLASLGVAFIVTPYLALPAAAGARARRRRAARRGARGGGRRARFGAALPPHHDAAHGPTAVGGWAFYGGVVALLLAARWGWCALQGGAGEDAAVRQQERVPGGARPARGHDARDVDARSARRSRRYLRTRARGAEHGGLRRHGGAVQLQRPGAALLPAPRAPTWPTCR